ncbi:MAG TPA: threonine synthase [Chitinophagaceae bacterium]|jgi:threonine synthase|nr:threonine synthase [Chitinophagaceae bacterium]
MKQETITNSFAAFLECSACKKKFNLSEINTYAKCCNKPLLVTYQVSGTFLKEDIKLRESTMWRYFEMLPVKDKKNIVSLGEGMTPIVRLSNLENKYGFSHLSMKDESFNPTGSFKARGISMAVSKMKELGIKKCIIPTAGSAGGALAAYCSKANIHCIVVMPTHAPDIFKRECMLYDAELVEIDGLISDCAKKANEINHDKNYFDVSTLREPYRLEGKKTMGYEIAEQLNWELPDVIIYPAGGGTGLIGIWKAFREMIQLGWVPAQTPKMIAVQSENCAPIRAAYDNPANWKKFFNPKPSIANGLVVPDPFGMDLIQKVIYESAGDVVAISEQALIDGIKEIAKTEGILLSPEGSATWKALTILVEKNTVNKSDNVLLLNTGTGYKYLLE